MEAQDVNSLITKYGEWFYRAVLLAAVFIGLYLNSRYVTREEFQILQKQVAQISTQFAVMVESNRVNDLQNDTLHDHEQRLRALERAVPANH
jgi:hypothetical protein